jgi:hypothetical protein
MPNSPRQSLGKLLGIPFGFKGLEPAVEVCFDGTEASRLQNFRRGVKDKLR